MAPPRILAARLEGDGKLLKAHPRLFYGLPKTYEFVRLGYLGGGPAASPTSEYLVNYDYDGNSDRLKQVTGTGLPSGGANYSYLAGSHLLEKIEFKQGSAVKAAVTRSYEPDRDLPAAVENKWGSDV